MDFSLPLKWTTQQESLHKTTWTSRWASLSYPYFKIPMTRPSTLLPLLHLNLHVPTMWRHLITYCLWNIKHLWNSPLQPSSYTAPIFQLTQAFGMTALQLLLFSVPTNSSRATWETGLVHSKGWYPSSDKETSKAITEITFPSLITLENLYSHLSSPSSN